MNTKINHYSSVNTDKIFRLPDGGYLYEIGLLTKKGNWLKSDMQSKRPQKK